MEIIKCVRAYAESSFCEKELVLNMDGIAALMGLLGGMLLFTWVIGATVRPLDLSTGI